MFRKRTRSRKRSVAVILTLALIFSTCAQSVFALGEQWQGAAKNDVVVKDTVTKLANSVYEHEVVTNNQSGTEQKIDYLCEVGKSKDIKIVAGYGQDDGSSWSLTPTTKQAAAYEKNHPGETVVAGINADFFNMANGQPQGALVMEGKVYNQANGRPFFGITKDGDPVIRQDNNLSDIEAAVGGDVILIANGKPITENTSYGALKYSRTAIGIKADGTVVTFVTHGLNAPISCGRTYTDIAEMLAAEGCVSALALDGGGSATYAGRPEGTDNLVVRNSPADGAERAVSSTLLVVSTAEPTGVFSHAQLTPNNEVYTPESEVKFEAKGVDTAGMSMPLPKEVKWALADTSKNKGTIDPDTGVFTAGKETGVVTVNMIYKDKVVGETKIEIAVPDHIYFGNEEISLGFEEKSDLGLVVRNKGRDMNYKAGDIKWTISDPSMGHFDGNTFISADGVSVNGDVTATSAFNDSVSGKIKVIVGKLPTIVWDFEDVENPDGTITPAQEYYMGTADKPGILTHKNYGRGGNETIEIASSDNDEPVRFGNNSLKMNYDFRNCGQVTEGACVGTTEKMTVPGVPTGIGVWVYAPEGVGIEYQGEGSQAGFWLRGYATDAQGSLVQYDFTLEPKHPDVVSGKAQPGIYWEGWKYLEADLTGNLAPFTVNPGMTFRLMFVHGTKMGTRTANSIYFDNLQFVYGANMDDIDDPYVASMQMNGAEFTNNMVVKTDTITIDAMLKDKEGKYATGIDDKTVRMYVDGVNVVGNDKYTYAYSEGDDRAQLSDLKLKDGKHSITIKARDGFGNEVNETRYFTVDTGNESKGTEVKVVPKTDKAVIGKTIDLQIVATDDTVTDSTTVFKLGNQFKNYKVNFGENYEGTSSYNKLEKTITVNATRKPQAKSGLFAKLLDKETVIATLSVDVPSDLKESDFFKYIVKGGKYETASGEYGTYSSSELKINVGAVYQIATNTVIVGGKPAEIKVTDANGKPVKDVTLYTAADNAELGKTDDKGILVTDMFNKAGAEAKDYVIYAKDADGGLSFEYKIPVYASMGDAAGNPHNVRFNTVKDPATQKNITWFSNPLDSKKQVLKYREHGTSEWTTVDAKSDNLTFYTGGNSSVNVNAVMLEGLKPDTVYDYVAGAEGSFTAEATFKTGAAGKKSNEFFIIGDIQDGDKTEVKEVAKQLDAKNNNYDFGIQIGDAIDQAANYTDWSELGEILGANMLGGTNMINIMGNHEYYGNDNATIAGAIYNNKNTAEGGCYSVEYNDVYVAVINYSNTASPMKAAAEWLVEDAAKSDATWKILCMHQPAYYTHEGGNAPVYQYIPDAAEKAGIDAVFSGHDHSWAVTNPLKDDKIDEENGIPYYIVGVAGDKRYPPETQDKFDYDTIFRKVGDPFDATYLKISSNQDEMTINVYDINKGLLDTVVLQSECKKHGHDNVYDPETNTLKCKNCGRTTEKHTGEVFDKDGKEYYLLAGALQKGWVTVGTEIRYYAENGTREKVTVNDVPSTCIVDGFCIYTSESGATKRIDKIDAGGHEIKVIDGKHICEKCGWQQFDMAETSVSLSTDVYTYNGKAKTPSTKAIDPNGNVLTKRPTAYPDYYSKYKNNVDVGTATVTLTAAKYGVYVDMTAWRGNYRNSVTVKYEIRPNAPTNAFVQLKNGKYTLKWDRAKYEAESVDEYVIYQSVNGGEWTEIATTTGTELNLDVDKNKNYEYRVASRKTAKDKKTYESAKCAEAKTLSLDVKTSYRESDAKPALSWNTNKGATYTVLRSTKPNTGFQEVFTTKGTTYTHVSAVPGRTYYYKVQAKANGMTAVSDVVSIKCALMAPKLAQIELNKDEKPSLNWSAVEGATSYDVYRSESKDGNFTKVFTTKGTSYTNTAAEPGHIYFYKVTASYNDVTSESEIMSVTCPIKAPTAELAGLDKNGKPMLRWNSVKGASGYEVYRAASGSENFEKIADSVETTYIDSTAEPLTNYTYKVRAVGVNKSVYADSEAVAAKSGEELAKVTRLSGKNRYETAVSAADSLKASYGVEKFDNIVVANGDNYVDALAGGYLANVKKAPVLLVNSASEAFVKNYIAANMSPEGTVYLLGGEGVVSKRFESSLSGMNVKRLGGRDRFETNLKILNEAGVSGSEVLVCSAWDFADSLSASSTGHPILLVDNKLNAAQKEYLKTLNTSYCAIGGNAAVSQTVENELKAFGAVGRLSGSTRYETSRAIAEKYYGANAASLVIASGDDFPDGLTGSTVAVANGAPIILANEYNSKDANEYLVKNGIKNMFVIGGAGAVSETVVNKVIS